MRFRVSTFPRGTTSSSRNCWCRNTCWSCTVRASDRKPGTKHFRIVFLPDEQTLTTAYAGIADFMKARYK